MGTTATEEKKAKAKAARHDQIVSVARRFAEMEGWQSVTVRRLAEEIEYSQPVLYSHFENREAIIAAVALRGFQELGVALQNATRHGKRTDPLLAAASTYLAFASESPATYEAMFVLNLGIPFGTSKSPPELRFAFAQLMALFSEISSHPEVTSEVFWACLHGLADLARTKRLPSKRKKERLQALVEAFADRTDV